MKRVSRFAYVVCVMMTIVLVVVGWFFTGKHAVVANFIGAKEVLSESVKSVRGELSQSNHEREQLKKDIEEKGTAILQDIETEKAISTSLINNLKERIEQDRPYVTQVKE